MRRSEVSVIFRSAALAAACGLLVAACSSDSQASDVATPDSEVATTESPTTVAASTTAPSTTATSTVPPATEPAVNRSPVTCQFSDEGDGTNPFGMRSFLRFEDRVEGGSAIVFESFGNASGDGAGARQAVFADQSAAEIFDRFLAGEPVADDVLSVPADAALLDEIGLGFTCSPSDAASWTGYEQVLPGEVVRRCAYDPELGPNPVGMRSGFTFLELADPGGPTLTVALFENFGNATGDGAAWRQSVFVDVGADVALEQFLSDPSYYSAATGDVDGAEVERTLELLAAVTTCS